MQMNGKKSSTKKKRSHEGENISESNIKTEGCRESWSWMDMAQIEIENVLAYKKHWQN